MLEKLAKSIEEVNVLAEHYRTCQNVAAIESLAKECFISKEDTDAFIAGKSCCLLKVPLMGQSGSVTEKLTEEMRCSYDRYNEVSRADGTAWEKACRASAPRRCDRVLWRFGCGEDRLYARTCGGAWHSGSRDEPDVHDCK